MGDDSRFDTGALRTLVVVLHAFGHSAQNLASIRSAIRNEWPTALVFCPDLPLGVLSMANPNCIVQSVLQEIDFLYVNAMLVGEPYDNIVLVGHSIGGLLARKLYIVACGETADAPFEKEYKKPSSTSEEFLLAAKPWAGKVSRIVLMAGINRGWQVSHHLDLIKAPLWSLGTVWCWLIYFFRRQWPLIFTVRRGAEFITQLRIQWLIMRRSPEVVNSGPKASSSILLGQALTVQLLGSKDDVVSPEDNVDLVSGGDFIYLDVPYSGHVDVVELDDPTHGQKRAQVFLLALTSSRDQLTEHQIRPSDDILVASNYSVNNVVFVIHGIRDAGYWTHKIARRVKHFSLSSEDEWATETSSYGYFPMLEFLLPWYRRRKVEWLMDQYAESLAKYPNAKFSYIGHSNGTYLLAKAMELYPCCRFKNVVFAGSVVRRTYDWQRFMVSTPRRINAILNFVATRDFVVASFPNLFQLLHLQDLGSAGHDGFVATANERFYQIRFVHGGHGAATKEPFWDIIAKFVVQGTVTIQDLQTISIFPKRNIAAVLTGLFPMIIWMAIATALYAVWHWPINGLIAGINWLICTLLPAASLARFVPGVVLAIYLWSIWMILTRL